MSGKAIDTNVVIEYFRGNVHAAELIESEPALAIPLPVAGELLYGAHRSTHPIRNITKIHGFLSQCTVLSLTAEVAETYATVKAQLAASGNPIPENDLWIAAAALVYSLSLITFDKHFTRIKKLVVIS